VSIVKNGSFEYDGDLILSTDGRMPKYFCDVNFPADRFTGYIDSRWWSHSSGAGSGRSLSFSSLYGASFEAGDCATISQQTYLADVNYITFDIQLTTDYPATFDWDPALFNAFVMVDERVAWDSNELQFTGNGTYHVEVNDINITDSDIHTLTLGMKAIAPSTTYINHIARWDFVKFDTYCGGLGYLPFDFDRNCYVDIDDMQILADEWLSSRSSQLDLFVDYVGDIDFRDFAVFASHWSDMNCHGPDYCGGCDFDQSGAVDINDLLTFAENWLSYSVLYSDIDGDGSVRFYDFAEFAGGWKQASAWQEYGSVHFSEPELILLESDLNDNGVVDYDDLGIICDNWLAGGSCVRADINTDGIVDFYDFLALAKQWRLKGTLYDWN